MSLMRFPRYYLTVILSICWIKRGARGFHHHVATKRTSHHLSRLKLGPETSSAIEVASLASENIPRALSLGGVPAVGMAATTLVGLKLRTPPSVVGALQHFSAGILLTTVAKELLPEMVQAEGLTENLASGLGFFGGVALLIGLGQILEHGGGESSSSEEETPQDTEYVAKQTQSPTYRLRNRPLSRQKEAFFLEGGGIEATPAGISNFLQEETTTEDTTPFIPEREDQHKEKLSYNTKSEDTRSFAQLLPTAFLIAIAVDAALDGLLIGISTATGDPSTGNILSASLLVESSFIGITIATALRGSKVPQVVRAVAALVGPIGTITGSVLGGILAPSLSPAGLACLLGFGTSTILFMVAEELLLGAHEEGEEHIWWVDFQLYTGFFASVMVEKLVGV